MDLLTRNGQLAGEASSPPPPTRPTIEQDGFTIVDCRGIKLMALPYNNLLYICVHEISMELWKMFDTPRVSVQKKIADLGIHLHQTTKTQVMILRREGIIGNFRATMITVRDAEKLYDALEYSRRKRGLVKHILKEPGKRASRAEEHGAKKLSLLSRYCQRKSEANARSHGGILSPVSAACSSSRLIVAQQVRQPPEQRAHASTLDTPPHKVPRDSPSLTSSSTPSNVSWCALNGNHTAPSALLKRNSNREEQEGEEDGDGCYTLLFDVLLCAKDPVLAGGSACKSHCIELLPNRRTVNVCGVSVSAGQERQKHMDKTIQRLGQSSKLSHTHLSATTNQITLRSFHPSTGARRRWSKPRDPDYKPSPYSEKTAQNLSSSSQPSRLCRNRERDSCLSVPSTSSGIRVNSLRTRQLSSPPLELNDLEEQSSVYSGVSGNSSRLMSSTPERFLYLDESSEEEEEEEREEGRGGRSDSDSVFSIEDSSSPEMRITVPGKGASNAMERRVVKTKLRHFAQTTSPQLTALSRGKHLPRNASPSPPPSPLSPLTVSITLANLKSHHEDAQSTPVVNVPTPPPTRPSNNSSLASSVRRKPGRPPNKHKSRPTALSTFVMKKRAMSPSMQSDDSSPCPSNPPPPPAKRSRLEYESDSSNGGRAAVAAVEEVMPKPKRGRPSLASKVESMKSQNVATNTPMSNSHYSLVSVQHCDVIDLRDDHATDVSVQTATKSQKASSTKEDSTPQGTSMLHNQSPQNEGMSANDGDAVYAVGPDGCGLEEEVVGESFYVPDDDQLSVTSSSTTSAPTAGHTSISIGNRGRGRGRGRRSLANSNAASKRGKQKNQYSNGFGCSFTSELQSLMSSSSKSSISFEEYFNFYPPKLVMKDGELVPEKSLSVKGIDRNTISSLPSGHPFMSWNLGRPVKGGVPIRGRKRRPPKDLRVT